MQIKTCSRSRVQAKTFRAKNMERTTPATFKDLLVQEMKQRVDGRIAKNSFHDQLL